MICPDCGKESGMCCPGGYYRGKREEANRIHLELKAAIAENPIDAAKVARLTQALEMATYVGD